MDTPTLTGDVECGAGTDLPVCNLHDGDLFPDTYRVARGTSRLAFLDLIKSRKDVSGVKYTSYFTGKTNIALWDENKFLECKNSKVVKSL